jgi:hypothetical protein
MSDNLPALIPGVKSAVMPTVETFASALRLKTYESGAIDWNVYIAPKRVIPVPACNAILAELEAASAPARKPIAARLAALLIGSYPAREMGNAEIFISVVTATFGRYPPEIGAAAAEELICTAKWLPSVAELTEACNKLMDERRYAAHVARKHLEHHAELERERAAQEKRIEERRKRYIAEPRLMIRDEFYRSFNVSFRDMEVWDEWLRAACQEFDVRTVEAWHLEAEQAGAKPDNWHFLRLFLNKCADKARQDRQP